MIEPAPHTLGCAACFVESSPPTAWLAFSIALLAFFALLAALLWQRLRHFDLQARLQRQVDETERIKDLSIMAGGLAHEIRHPVSAVQFALASARERLGRIDEGRERDEIEGILDGIHDDIKRIDEITNAFLAYARPEAQPAADCDLAQACDFVHRFLKVEIRARGARLDMRYPESPVVARIPEVHLRQILMNLLQNAAQASPDGGTIELTVSAQRDRAVVTIDDQGAGISDDDVANLFKPFFSTKSDGVGLGLALSRRLARDAGGDLRHERAASGGARFILELPLVHEASQNHTSTQRRPETSTQS